MTSFHKKLTILLVFILVCSGSTTGLMGKESKIKGDRLNFFNKLLQTAEIGAKVNVTLHQSYVSPTTIVFSNLSDSNEVALPCPTEISFNSSYTEFSVDDIYVPNKTINVETSPDFFQGLYPWFYTSFRVESDCILKTVKVNIRSTAEGHIFYFDVYNSMLNNSYITPDQDLNGGMYFLGEIYNNSTTNIWLNLTGLSQELDVNTTYNDTFFICLFPSGPGARWYCEGEANGIDDTISWANGPSPESGLDFTLIVEVAPLNNNPKPSQIDLKINNTSVSDNLDNSGFWTSTEEYSNPSGQLGFELSADWWDVACNITKAQINYTKTDLKASTEYEILEPDLVIWNASIDESIDSFDSRIDDYNYISFVVPENWSDIRAFNGIVEKPVDVSASIINGYQEVIVLHAENGANWYLTASVDNRSPGNGGGTIPFGNYYLLFTTIVIISLIYFRKRRLTQHF